MRSGGGGSSEVLLPINVCMWVCLNIADPSVSVSVRVFWIDGKKFGRCVHRRCKNRYESYRGNGYSEWSYPGGSGVVWHSRF